MKFPELNRHEQDSMKASEAFLCGLSRRILNSSKKKVFVIGFHKTGTSSLGKALQMLGFKVCGSLKGEDDLQLTDFSDFKLHLLKKAEQKAEIYDAFQDTPWFLIYKELYTTYPDAYFILTKREEQSWIKSVNKHFGDKYYEYHNRIYGTLDSLNHKELYINRYKKHNQEVSDFFEHKGNFLVLDIKNFNWDRLCGFLDVNVPLFKFPHANKASSRGSYFNKNKSYIKKHYYKK